MPVEKNSEYYQLLLQRWQQRKCSPDEALELMDYLQQNGANRILLSEMQAAFYQVKPDGSPDSGEYSARVREELLKRIQSTPVKPMPPGHQNRARFRYAAAAAIVIGISLPTAWYIWQKQTKGQKPIAAKTAPPTDVLPGKNKAVLTLANGEKVVLDSTGMQQLAQQGNNTTVNKNGQLVYIASSNDSQSPVYNTLTTAAGEAFPLVLADGSRVWLNAASSIRFPVSFSSNERVVDLSGEAYFEIRNDAHRPFRVNVNKMSVDVLGTSFNINAYPDENTINTTLLEGAVKVNSGNNNLQLAPGEQSQVSINGNIRKITGVNTGEIIAWKDGYFQFENTDLTNVLKQFSHWYNVDIVYEGHVKPRKFFGMISRNSSLMNVLKMLNANDVAFRLEGRKLIVQGEK